MDLKTLKVANSLSLIQYTRLQEVWKHAFHYKQLDLGSQLGFTDAMIQKKENVDIICQCIINQKKLQICYFFDSKLNGVSGLKIVFAMTRLTTLTQINLGLNKTWFKSEEFIENLCLTISRQIGLKELYLGFGNHLSSCKSLKILQVVGASPTLQTITSLSLSHCNWDEQANCEELANLIA